MRELKEKCFVTGVESNKTDLVPANTIRKNLAEFIQKERPDFDKSLYISHDALQDFRKRYLESLIEDENGKLDKVENEVLEAISRQEFIADNLTISDSEKPTYGQHIADKVAAFGGSWTFIISFFIVLMLWIMLNSAILTGKAFDPYPYILLNLILSCIAALQAPVIMMSQNRQETKDRLRSEYDYKVNLKAELEIRMLHEKIDHLMIHQTQQLLELQQMQIDLLEDLVEKKKEK